MNALFETGVELLLSCGVGGPMWGSPDIVGVPGGSSLGPPNGEPRSVKFNVVKGLLSTLMKLGDVLITFLSAQRKTTTQSSAARSSVFFRLIASCRQPNTTETQIKIKVCRIVHPHWKPERRSGNPSVNPTTNYSPHSIPNETRKKNTWLFKFKKILTHWTNTELKFG